MGVYRTGKTHSTTDKEVLTSRHQRAREEMEENKKPLKIVMFDSQESRVNRSQDLKKRKKEHSRI